jgi:hypothetical protein
MSKTSLWVITALLLIVAFYILFIYLPGRQSELAKKGIQGEGTVQMKDSRPTGPDGSTEYYVTLIYQDAQHKNHQVTRQMFDVGAWEGLAAGKDVKVYYLPSDPDNGSIPGAEGMTTPRAGAFRFLAWSAILASIITGFLAYRAKPKQSGGPVMSRR